MITSTLKQDDLAAAFSTTLLAELEQNYSSGLVENNVFIRGNSEVYLFCLSILFADKTSKKIFSKPGSGNIKVYAPKFLPITPVKAFPKFEFNIYSDIGFQSAISVSSTGNSRYFTELTDRLAFVNFSSPGPDCSRCNNVVISIEIEFDPGNEISVLQSFSPLAQTVGF